MNNHPSPKQKNNHLSLQLNSLEEKKSSSDNNGEAAQWQPCSLPRRLGAILYDSLLLICVVFFAWQPMPAISGVLDQVLPEVATRGVKLTYLIAICFIYFAWPWSRSGQTLGMKAWRVKLVALEDYSATGIPWRICWLRFICAMASWTVLGLGFLSAMFHPRKLAWHDLYSRTRLVTM